MMLRNVPGYSFEPKSSTGSAAADERPQKLEKMRRLQRTLTP